MEEFSLNSFNLTDKVVLITGGASGLGQYYTQAVSKVGADVFIGVSKPGILTTDLCKGQDRPCGVQGKGEQPAGRRTAFGLLQAI